jgi:hypothetical protein
MIYRSTRRGARRGAAQCTGSSTDYRSDRPRKRSNCGALHGTGCEAAEDTSSGSRSPAYAPIKSGGL